VVGGSILVPFTHRNPSTSSVINAPECDTKRKTNRADTKTIQIDLFIQPPPNFHPWKSHNATLNAILPLFNKPPNLCGFAYLGPNCISVIKEY